jgi:hypothetical protein
MMPSDSPAEPTPVELVAKLEALDDVIFPAIDGDAAALEAAPDVWTATVAKSGGPPSKRRAASTFATRAACGDSSKRPRFASRSACSRC